MQLLTSRAARGDQQVRLPQRSEQLRCAAGTAAIELPGLRKRPERFEDHQHHDHAGKQRALPAGQEHQLLQQPNAGILPGRSSNRGPDPAVDDVQPEHPGLDHVDPVSTRSAVLPASAGTVASERSHHARLATATAEQSRAESSTAPKWSATERQWQRTATTGPAGPERPRLGASASQRRPRH